MAATTATTSAGQNRPKAHKVAHIYVLSKGEGGVSVVSPCTDVNEGSSLRDEGNEQRAALHIYHGKRQIGFRRGMEM
jgi:hypothetical protein